jgi:hypothetical protein
MSRTTACGVVLAAALLAVPHAAVRAETSSREQAAGQVSAADAAPFIGEWTLTLQGERGPGTFDLNVKVEKDKVVGEITGAQMPAQRIEDAAMADKSLILNYSFPYEGQAISTAIKLTPAAEGKTNAEMSFAGGAYVMSGTAAKKEKAK